MKKTISILITAVMILSFIATEAMSSDEATEIDIAYSEKYYSRAAVLIGAITNTFPTQVPTEKITRGEFANLLVSVCNMVDCADNSDSVQLFSDVPTDSSYYSATRILSDRNIIFKSENFEPDRIIARNEAVKMIIASAGYIYKAEAMGGYPQGYLAVASELKILKNLSDSAQVSYADAWIMMYNYLFADALETDTVHLNQSTGETESRYIIGKNNYLYYYFGYECIEGIVTETRFNSYAIDHKISDRTTVIISGKSYESKGMTAEMLGKSISAVCNKDDEILAFWETNYNDEFTVSVEDYREISNMMLSYTNNGKKKQCRLDDSYIVLYNDRRTAAITEEMLRDNNAKIILLNNDSDDEYEIIKVYSNVYGIIDTVDVSFNTISVSEPYAMHVDLGEDTEYRIHSRDGKSFECFELEKGMAVAIKASQDGKLADITVLDKSISGIITAISTDDEFLEIDNAQYKMSKAFFGKYFDDDGKLGIGNSIDVVLADGDLIVCLSSRANSLQYGFLQKFDYSTKRLSEKLKFKIFTADGKFKIVEARDKITLDGVPRKTKADVVTALGAASFSPQIIKYQLDTDGYLIQLDIADDYNELAASNPGYVFGDPMPTNNSLINYGKRPSSYSQYRSGFKGIVGFADLTSTTIFAVPHDLDDDDEYEIYSRSNLDNAVSYEWTLYDVSPTGAAGAAIFVKELTSVNKRSWPAMIVESIRRGTDEYGGDIWRVRGWLKDSYVSYTMDKEVMDNMNESTPDLITENVSVGDIICVDVSKDKIKNLSVAFEYTDKDKQYKYLGKHSQESTFFVNKSVEEGLSDQGFCGSPPLFYMCGYAYSCATDRLFIGLSQTLDSVDNRTFDYKNMRLTSVATSRIICFDREEKTLTPISLSQVNTYQGSGSRADFVIVRNKEDGNDAIYVIR